MEVTKRLFTTKFIKSDVIFVNDLNHILQINEQNLLNTEVLPSVNFSFTNHYGVGLHELPRALSFIRPWPTAAPKSTIAQPTGSFHVIDSFKNVTPKPIETIGTKNITEDAMIEPAASRTFKFHTNAMPLQMNPTQIAELTCHNVCGACFTPNNKNSGRSVIAEKHNCVVTSTSVFKPYGKMYFFEYGYAMP